MIRVTRHTIIPAIMQVRHIAPKVAAAAWSPADWWTVSGKTCYAAYQSKGAPNFTLSLTDLTGNGHHATVGAQPDWDATNGWKFNGSTHYLITSHVSDTDQSQAMIVQYSNHDGGDYENLCGSWTGAGGTGRWWLSPKWGTKLCFSNHNDTQVGSPATAGNLCVSGQGCYYNGTSVGTGVSNSQAMTYPTYIGGKNSNGGATGLVYAYIQAFAIYTDELSAAEVAVVAAAMAAL